VNIVRPGGASQVSHRDYHLGFQSAEACARYPRAMQVASQFLTLQGAVAHSDMPVDSGSTRLLPFSQMFEEGYMAYRLPAFTEFFLERYVALPLEMGDGLFFNPALFHAAGENKTEGVVRSANLLQISSAFGRPMESVDSIALVESCWYEMVKMKMEGGMGAVESIVKAVAEGYPFPTNLDRRPPAPGGMAPESEQDVVKRALEEKWDVQQVVEKLRQIKRDSEC
jgi:ectoine hydroxylase-related dioxygenase (phytanoyl-CoA dioxygenase family)